LNGFMIAITIFIGLAPIRRAAALLKTAPPRAVKSEREHAPPTSALQGSCHAPRIGSRRLIPAVFPQARGRNWRESTLEQRLTNK
jgi:hypothetical protein